MNETEYSGPQSLNQILPGVVDRIANLAFSELSDGVLVRVVGAPSPEVRGRAMAVLEQRYPGSMQGLGQLAARWLRTH